MSADSRKFSPGDVVSVRSGGPRMTVEIYDESGEFGITGVRCVWFPHESILMRQCFKESVLELSMERK